MESAPSPHRHGVIDHPQMGRVRVAPFSQADRERAAEAFRRLSAETRQLRFWTRGEKLSDRLLDRILDTDPRRHGGWYVTDEADDLYPGFGAASWWRLDDSPSTAETAFTVADAWQSRGVGTLLIACLWIEAWAAGIEHFVAYAQFENERVVDWWHSLGGRVASERHQHVMTIDLVAPGELVTADPHPLPPPNRKRFIDNIRKLQAALDSAR